MTPEPDAYGRPEERAPIPLALVLALLAVLVATFQAFLTWSSRNDQVEALIAGRKLDACATVGVAAADFLAVVEKARAEREAGRLSTETFDQLIEAPRLIARANYVARYILPADSADDLATMRDRSILIRGAVPQGDRAQLDGYVREVELANERVQARCGEILAGSRFLQ